MSAESWLVLYDLDCGFCKWTLSILLRWDRRRVLRPRPLQAPEVDHLLGRLSAAERTASFHLVTPQGELISAGAALPALLRALPGGAAPARVLESVPAATDRGYRWIAENRSQLSKFVPARAKTKAARLVAVREKDPIG